MKTKPFILLPLIGLTCGIVAFTSCTNRYYKDDVPAVGLTNGVYDQWGFPIFGYVDGAPVYAYTSHGTPVYDRNSIRRDYYVPAWTPSTSYNQTYVYPSYVKKVNGTPHARMGWRPPVFDKNKPYVTTHGMSGAQRAARSM